MIGLPHGEKSMTIC